MNKEIGILFKQDMVRAILAGRKTQTRRICKPQPDVDDHPQLVPGYMELENHWGKWAITTSDGESKLIKCRYGASGDLLYAKEAYNEWPKGEAQYRASTASGEELGLWKSPLFMPKSAARIWLRNTGVRVERLQDISEADAIAEGIESFRPVPGDRVLATIRHKTDGTKNRHNVPVIVTGNDTEKRKILGATETGYVYVIPYNELKEIPLMKNKEVEP